MRCRLLPLILLLFLALVSCTQYELPSGKSIDAWQCNLGTVTKNKKANSLLAHASISESRRTPGNLSVRPGRCVACEITKVGEVVIETTTLFLPASLTTFNRAPHC